jgi:hypothetical protein
MTMPTTLLGSWIDPGALAALAHDLCPEKGADPSPDGFDHLDALERFSVVRGAARNYGSGLGRAVPSPVLESSVAPEAFVVPEGSLTDRLEAFGDWAAVCVGDAQVFVVDTQGDPIVIRGGEEEVRAASVLLADAGRRAAGQVGAGPGETLRLDLQNGLVLSILPILTSDRLMVLGVRGTHAISTALATALREGIALAVEGRG